MEAAVGFRGLPFKRGLSTSRRDNCEVGRAGGTGQVGAGKIGSQKSLDAMKRPRSRTDRYVPRQCLSLEH